MHNQRIDCLCQFCKLSVHKHLQQRLHDRYFESFNFYFAKPITEILANIPVDHVILFKDLLYLHDENEYMKRFYAKEEVDSRLRLLSDIYESQQQGPSPNLSKVCSHKVMEKRQNKIQKLQQKAQVNNDQQPVMRQMIPDRIFSENYVENSLSDSYPQNQISWDSKSHNIYESKAEILNAPPLPRLPLKQSGDQHKLFNCENDPELDNVYNEVNTQTQRLLNAKVPSISNRFKKTPQNDSKKIKAHIPPLKLQDSAKSSSTTANKSSTIQNLMKKYDQILQKRFQVKEILTERNEIKATKKGISDEMLIKIYKQHLEQMKKSKKQNQSENYQFHACYKNLIAQPQQPAQSCTFEKENERKKKFTNKVYLPKPIVRKPPSQISSPSTTNMQNTCSPSMLLRSLSNPSMAPSPARRLEIKVNLNKLIHQQDEEVGYWTQRCKMR